MGHSFPADLAGKEYADYVQLEEGGPRLKMADQADLRALAWTNCA